MLPEDEAAVAADSEVVSEDADSVAVSEEASEAEVDLEAAAALPVGVGVVVEPHAEVVAVSLTSPMPDKARAQHKASRVDAG